MTNSTARRRGRHAAPSTRTVLVPRLWAPARRPAPARHDRVPVSSPPPVASPPLSDSRSATAVALLERPREPVAPPPGKATPIDLPGMQLLGFYDEEFAVAAEGAPAPPAAPRARPEPASQVRGVVANATARIQELWDTTDISFESLERLVPARRSGRRLAGTERRTASLVWLCVAALAVVLMIWLLVARPASVAAEARDEAGAAAETVLAAVRPLSTLSGRLGDETAPDLVVATGHILDAETAARSLFTAGGALADTDENRATRDAAVEAAGIVLDATTRLNRLVAYRLSAEQALVLPVPAPAEGTTVEEITGELAAWRVDVTAVVEGLPDGVLPTDRARLLTWSGELQAWQEGYLDAFREGNMDAVEAAVAAQNARVADLRRQLLGDLGDVGAGMASSLEDVDATLVPLLPR